MANAEFSKLADILGASLVAQTLKNMPAMQETSGRSPGEGNDYPLQYSCLENSIARGAWQATAHGVPRVMAPKQQQQEGSPLDD